MMKLRNFRYCAGTIGLASFLAFPSYVEASYTPKIEPTKITMTSFSPLAMSDFDFSSYLGEITEEEVKAFEEKILQARKADYENFQLRFEPNSMEVIQGKVGEFVLYLSQLLENPKDATTWSEKCFVDFLEEKENECKDAMPGLSPSVYEKQMDGILKQLAVGYYINLNYDVLDDETLMELNREYHLVEEENPTKNAILYYATKHYVFFDISPLKEMLANEQDYRAFEFIEKKERREDPFLLPETFEERCKDFALSSVVLKSFQSDMRGSGFSCHRYLLGSLVAEYRDHLEEETIEFVGFDIDSLLATRGTSFDVSVFYQNELIEKDSSLCRVEEDKPEVLEKKF